MNILITGGAGFIGSNLSKALVERGHNVTVLDNLSEQIHGRHAPLPEEIAEIVTFIRGDVRNASDWNKALPGQDVVVHLAAETGTGQSMYEVHKYVDVNISGTAILLDYLVNHSHQIKKVVVASSRAIFGEGKYRCPSHGEVYPNHRIEDDLLKGDFEPKCPHCLANVLLLPTDEDSKIHPTSIYGITKQNQEQMVMNVCRSLGIPAVAFRYQNVYGPGQSLKNPYTGILSIFSTQIRNGSDLNIFEDGKESRDFVYIDDVVEATLLGIEKDEANYEVFNVGCGEAVSVLNVATTLKDLYGSEVSVQVSGNYRLGDIRHNYADLSKIKNRLGFSPKFNFDRGVRNFVEWVLLQEKEEDRYDLAMSEMKERGLFK